MPEGCGFAGGRYNIFKYKAVKMCEGVARRRAHNIYIYTESSMPIIAKC